MLQNIGPAGWWVGFAACGGIVAAAWSYIRQSISYFTSMAVVNVTVDGTLPAAVSLLCWHRLRRSPFGSRQYTANSHFVKPLSRYLNVAYETLGKSPVVFWDKYRPILLSNRGEEGRSDTLKITYIRGMWNMDDLIKKATVLLNDRQEKGTRSTRFFVHRCFGSGPLIARRGKAGGSNEKSEVSTVRSSSSDAAITQGDVRILGWSPDDIGQAATTCKKALDRLALPHGVDVLVEELKRWKDSELWFKEKAVPWRRGWLLYGRPGCGKTSLIRAVAQDCDMPIFVYDLASMSNDELIESWKRMMASVPCIALLEDIDAIFNGRENILGDNGGGLTFDCLLNVIGGVETADGVLMVITTNFVEKLDVALGKPVEGSSDMMSTRPGRIDRAFELKELGESQRLKIAHRILSDFPEEIETIVKSGDGDSGAQFQERCSQLALRLFWEKKEKIKVTPAMQRVEKPFGDVADIEQQLSALRNSFDPHVFQTDLDEGSDDYF